jgi:hypothetical protein
VYFAGHAESISAYTDMISFDGMFTDSIFDNDASRGLVLALILLFSALSLPNTQQVMFRYMQIKPIYAEVKPPVPGFISWKPGVTWLVSMVVVTLISLYAMIGSVSEFLYFQF